MRIRLIPLALLAALLGTSSGIHAQELPPPRLLPLENRSLQPMLPPAGTIAPPFGMARPVLPPPYRPGPVLPLAASPYPPPGYQPSAYQVWQNYTVTYNGWLRPRVIQTPNGSGYFLYNGAPYPYANVMPGRLNGLSIGPAGAPAP